jgi:hypothetical protein
MNKSALLIGALLLTSITAPVLAQTNTSNSSGSNATNAAGFSSQNGAGVSKFNSDVIQQSQQLSNDLKAAAQAYQNVEQQANQNNPRSNNDRDKQSINEQKGTQRFTRQRKCNCTNPEQARLEEAKAKANTFLESIKNPTSEMLQKQAAGSRQAW